MKKGKFIVFEGLNGCGKGTQIEKIHNYLLVLGKAVPIFTTGEPNNFDKNGIKAREMLKAEGDPYPNQLKAMKYFAENRKTHNKILGPLLEKGVFVISDRYYYSNLAYQHAQGVSYKKIASENKEAIRPDLTFILDTTPEESARRLKLRDGNQGRKFDSNLNFNKKVWENYLSFREILPSLMGDNSIVYLDGMKSSNEIFEQIKDVYNNRFN